MPDDDKVEAEGWLILEAETSYWNNTAVRGARIVGYRKNYPTSLKEHQIAVKMTVKVNRKAFIPTLSAVVES